MWNLCKEYCKSSSFHGLELIVSRNKSIKERVFWGCLIVIATVLLSQNIYLLGMKATHSNVELIVDNPNYSLENADFPGVTVCSNSKVMKSKLFSYLKFVRMASNSNKTRKEVERFIHSVLALDLMKYPFLHHPFLYMERFNKNLHHIPNEEIFNLFLTVRPDIDEMINNCKWRGRTIKCRQLFRKQMTEEGFCYSFNSRTADRSLDDLPRVPPEMKPDGSLECLRNNAAGRDSGLSFSLKSLDSEMFRTNLQTRGYSVMVHDPNSYPQVSNKYLVFWKNFTVSRINVLVTTFRTDQTFARIPESARGCNMTRVDPYLCMLKCRKREILERCGCLPYYMYHFNRYAETCGIQHFKCLSENNKRFRNPRVIDQDLKIPAWTEPMSMNCKCVMPCSYTSYATEYSYIPKEEVTGEITPQGSLGFVEVVYKINYATSYIRRARFTWSDFLVDVGSLAGLFLGCSIITMIELAVFLYKLTIQVFSVVIQKRTVVQPYVE